MNSNTKLHTSTTGRAEHSLQTNARLSSVEIEGMAAFPLMLMTSLTLCSCLSENILFKLHLCTWKSQNEKVRSTSIHRALKSFSDRFNVARNRTTRKTKPRQDTVATKPAVHSLYRSFHSTKIFYTTITGFKSPDV